ncbi:MAG: glutamine--fructose-6-phosphate transaminase (isomerizing) [Gemmataceae bacterium]
MCGIVGYTGPREAEPLLLEGLRSLEYRGYDSSGLATLAGHHLIVRKRAGRVARLAELLARQPAPGCTGISHTRWATHGGATDANAHPHVGGNGQLAVVHNGIIENFADLKRELQSAGVVFRSDTDTEVIAHIIAQHDDGDLVQAVRRALGRLKGTYGLAVVSRSAPGTIVGACLGSPLVIGVGQGEHFLASDANALSMHTLKVIYLKDRQLCVLTPEAHCIFDSDLEPVAADIHELEREATSAGLGSYPHFMLKEIFDQPEALTNAMRGRLDDADATAHFGGLNLEPGQLRQMDRVVMTACGTSYHAALVGEYLFEEFARLPVEVEYASELRYRNPPMGQNTVVLALTQSGETADTLAAVRESKRKGHPTLAVCNVVGSSIAREADGGVYLHAGPEIGVASTKAFTAQLAVLAMLALHFGRLRHMSSSQGARFISELHALPDLVRQALKCHGAVRRVADRFAHARNMLYLGRHYLYPLALEGALKLKETSYIHAEGYPAAEMKHGPIALVDEQTPSVFLAPRSGVFEKVMSNMQEIRARGGPVIAIAAADDREVASVCDELIPLPPAPEHLQPLVAAIPLQLLAYEFAVQRGCDVDKPRNLAKSVTVE